MLGAVRRLLRTFDGVDEITVVVTTDTGDGFFMAGVVEAGGLHTV